jgi:acid phosphatase family membrane protein YuiD
MAECAVSFVQDLTVLLNRYSQENGSDTPDFILAEYLLACLVTWNTHVVRRDAWYGERQRKPANAPITTGDV